MLLAEYIIHFKELHDIFATQNGKGFHDTYVAMHTEGFNELTAGERAKLQREAYDHWIGLLFLKHTDMRHFGSLIDDLQVSFACNHNEYPHSLEKVIDMLDSWKLDTNIKSNTTGSEKVVLFFFFQEAQVQVRWW